VSDDDGVRGAVHFSSYESTSPSELFSTEAFAVYEESVVVSELVGVGEGGAILSSTSLIAVGFLMPS